MRISLMIRKRNKRHRSVKKGKKGISTKRIKPLRVMVNHQNDINDMQNSKIIEDAAQNEDILLSEHSSGSSSSHYCYDSDSSEDEFIPFDMEKEVDYSTDGEEEILDGIKIQSSESFRYQQCFSSNIQEDIINAINAMGFTEYFTADFGGAISHQYINTWARRLSRFLNFTYYSMHNTYLEPSMVIDWVKSIIETQFKIVFPKYITHLKDRLELKPNSILVEIYDIKKFMEWFVYIRVKTESDNSCSNMDCLKPLLYVLGSICKCERKQLKKNNSENQDLETLIENRQLPAGGLKELQQCLQKDLLWVKTWATALSDDSNFVGKNEYNRFMQVLYAAMYVYSPQGRISGIESMKVKQGYEILQTGCAFSTNFKTNSTFGYQPVTSSKLSRKLLQIYIAYLRPRIRLGGGQPLFLNHNGTPATRIGDKILAYFKSYHQLHITTTNIRKLTETEADAMYDNGQISAVAKKAVSNINGHSDQTVKNYYVKKKRRQDAEDGQEMYNVLSMDNPLSSDGWFTMSDSYEHEEWNHPPESTVSNMSVSDDHQVDHQQVQLPSPRKQHLQSPTQERWGEDHPEFNSPKSRIAWSDEENKYIREWWIKSGSNCVSNVASKLLAHINKDENAHRIFHPNHTLDSGRIRHGLRINGFNK